MLETPQDVLQRLTGFLSTAITATSRRNRLRRSIGFVISLTINTSIEQLDARTYKAIQLGVLGFVGTTKGNSRLVLSRGNNAERRLGSALARLSNKMRARAVPLYYYC